DLSAARSARPTRTRRRPKKTCPDAGGAGSARIVPSARPALPLSRHVFKLLVLGATGFVGSSVCEKLVERSGGADSRIRVATRHRSRARHLQLLPTVEIDAGDVHDDATLARMLRDTDAVINLVAILHGSEAEFERVHVGLPQRLAAACRRAGVKRLVHVSAIGVAADAPSRYLRSKARGEAVLRAAGLGLTVLRP